MNLEFEKFHGVGNDFIIIDNRDLGFPANAQLIATLCHRSFGIGADGLLLVEPSINYRFRMRYFNPDGLEATFCGNGGRCIAAWASDHSPGSLQLDFEATDGIHQAWVEKLCDNEFNVILTLNPVPGYNRYPDGIFLNTGTEHFVQLNKNPDLVDIAAEGRRLRYDTRFEPHGTNVNFLLIDGDRLVVRTYEKGVENETLSCGTGATACALVAMIEAQQSGKWLDIRTKGGNLRVYAEANGNQFHNIRLQGNAIRVFKGMIQL